MRFVWRLGFATVLLAMVAFLVLAGSLGRTGVESRAIQPLSHEAAIGAVLADGGLYHVDTTYLDHRALVAARIKNLSETPDVVIIADRAWQLVQQDLRWGRRVFGAYVDGLKPADIRRILSDLSARERLPKKVILGIGPDYVIQQSGALKLASAGLPANAAEPVQLASVSRVKTVRKWDGPRPGLTPYDRKLDTLYPDGSIVWSTARMRALADQNQAGLVSDRVETLKQRIKRSSFSEIVETGEIIAETKSRGVEVVIALTPLHPDVYGQIYNRQTAFRLHEGIEDLLAVARELDVFTLGSFEPFAAGCRNADFVSVTVLAPTCLSRLLSAGFVVGSEGEFGLDSY